MQTFGRQATKPTFQRLWQHFPCAESRAELYETLGWGNIVYHQAYRETCEIRMSYALLRAEVALPGATMLVKAGPARGVISSTAKPHAPASASANGRARNLPEPGGVKRYRKAQGCGAVLYDRDSQRWAYQSRRRIREKVDSDKPQGPAQPKDRRSQAYRDGQYPQEEFNRQFAQNSNLSPMGLSVLRPRRCNYLTVNDERLPEL